MYKNSFVVCVLQNGVPVSESRSGNVRLPEGGEFGIRLRNKNNFDACANVFLDGENVSGGGYIVRANSYVDILRHNNRDTAFRLVSQESPDAVDYGKNHVSSNDAGKIEVRFRKFEEETTEYQVVPLIYKREDRYPEQWPDPMKPWRSPYDRQPYWLDSNHLDDSPTVTLSTSKGLMDDCVRNRGYNAYNGEELTSGAINTENAVVVDGGKTGQNFSTVKGKEVGPATVITLRLKIRGKTSSSCLKCDAARIGKSPFCNQCGSAY